MKRYESTIFCETRKNKQAFPHKNVTVSLGYSKLDKMLASRPFKLIHARFATSGIRMLPVKEKFRLPLVTSFHGCDSPNTDNMKRRKAALKRLFAAGDCFTVPCQAMKDELIQSGCPEDKVVVHYSGIDVSKFSYKERKRPDDGAVRIIYVGRLVEKKGAALLIKAFHKVHQAYPKAMLYMIGDGKLRPSLVQLSRALKLQNRIVFLGALSHDEVAKQLEQAHLFCLPSMRDRSGNQEGIPNAIKEAMASGLPVISTKHSGIPELIEDGKTGHLVAEKDIDGLASKLIQLISKPEGWKKLGRNARKKIETDFNLQIQIEKLEQLFDRVIHEHEQSLQKLPFFSVIIPTYNRALFIGKAIKSVLKQTYTDFEIIVVDDGSTDRTAKVVKSFKDDRVRYVYQKNQGPSQARNTGIQLAQGEYVAFLDSDDRFLPNKLLENKKFIDANPKCRFLYSWYYDRKKGKGKQLVRNLRGYSNVRTFYKKLYKRKFTIRTSTAVIHRSCFNEIGLFNPKYRYSQDWDLWLRLSCLYPGYCQQIPLAIYRRHPRKKIPGGKNHYKIRQTAHKLFLINVASKQSK